MSKIQTMFSLFLLLVLIFSMDMIFGNPIRETFSNNIGLPGGRNVNVNEIGTVIKPNKNLRINSKNGNLRYSGNGFLGISRPYPKEDDQPLYYGYSQ